MDGDLELSPVEARVLGSLIEKSMATPQHYPLTLNALVAACNQSTNRDPVVDYSDEVVEEALASLRGKGVVRLVHPSHGARVPKHRHVLDERLRLEPAELAVTCVLLLRGPQTAGELRARTERLASAADAEAVIDALVRRDPPLVVRLERAPGQKEVRVASTLVDARRSRARVPDYVVLVVDDVDVALAFWVDVLGLRLGHRSGPYAQLDTGATRLALYARDAMRETLGDPDARDRFEIGFKVDDVDREIAALVAAGATLVSAPVERSWGQRTAYVRDPDGHLVELAQDLSRASSPQPGEA